MDSERNYVDEGGGLRPPTETSEKAAVAAAAAFVGSRQCLHPQNGMPFWKTAAADATDTDKER